MPDGRVVDIEVERFENARDIYSGGVLQDSHGRLRFETEYRREVLSGGVAFIAVETRSPDCFVATFLGSRTATPSHR